MPLFCPKQCRTSNGIQSLDGVAFTEDLRGPRLSHGQLGTVVESLVPNIFAVGFSDYGSYTRASLALRALHLMALHYRYV
jgi:hypothetical protein